MTNTPTPRTVAQTGLNRPQSSVVVRDESYYVGTPVKVTVDVRAATAHDARVALGVEYAKADRQLQALENSEEPAHVD